MNRTFLGLLFGLSMCLIGAVLLWASGSYAAHQQHLESADQLAAASRFAEASQRYEAAEADYSQTFWGIPQGLLLQKFDQFGINTRVYIQLQRAEMAFREGEQLLSSQAKSAISQPSINDIGTHFKTSAAQYQSIHGQTGDPFWQFLAHANRARALVQTFLIQAYFTAEPTDPSSLKQSLTRAIKSLQSALNAIYTDDVRVASADARNLVLLLESLTRFQHREDIEAAEERRVERFFKNMLSVPEIAPFGDIFRSSDPKSLSNKTGAQMRDLMLNQRPDPSAQEQTNRPSEASRSGRGSADSGSEGKRH